MQLFIVVYVHYQRNNINNININIMALFSVKGEKTEANKVVFDFAERVLQINKAISLYVNGAYITGTFRGKKENEYKYCYTTKSFIYEGASYQVAEAFEQAKNQ